MTRFSVRSRLFVMILSSLLPAALAGAGKKEMDILQSDVDELQRQIYDLKRLAEKQSADLERVLSLLDATPDARRERAEFNANIDSLRTEIRSLAGRFESTEHKLSDLERQVLSRCGTPQASPGFASPTGGEPGGEPALPTGETGDETGPGPVPTPSGALPAPTETQESGQVLFQQAYSDYIKDSFELAVSEFGEYIERYPNSDLADNAQYWIAMSYFNQKKYEECIREIETMLNRYPEAENAPEAMYRKGLSLLALDRLGQAVLVFSDVQSRYPDTPAGRQAGDRLREVGQRR